MSVELNFVWIVVIVVGLALLFLLKDLIYKFLRNSSLKLTLNKDIEVIKIFTEKFPLVSSDFINKSAKEQNIENNQEIHEINKRLELLENILKNYQN